MEVVATVCGCVSMCGIDFGIILNCVYIYYVVFSVEYGISCMLRVLCSMSVTLGARVSG